jgi:DNA-binding PadR family transcriptional regulator
MPSTTYLGEFEQMVLLAILQGGKEANALQIRKELEESANRTVSKGAFYTTLDRLDRKGYLTWKAVSSTDVRGGLPQRYFEVTPEGIAELRKSRDALMKLWRGLNRVLGSR